MATNIDELLRRYDHPRDTVSQVTSQNQPSVSSQNYGDEKEDDSVDMKTGSLRTF